MRASGEGSAVPRLLEAVIVPEIVVRMGGPGCAIVAPYSGQG
jgi:hypothetical protein